MGNKAYHYFLKAGAMGGVKARTRLSVLTRTASVQAKSAEDTPELLARFEQAMNTLTKELGVTANHNMDQELQELVETDAEKLRKTRGHLSLLADLLTQRAVFGSTFAESCARFTEAIADGMQVERASIWLFEQNPAGLVCTDLFEQSKRTHSAGTALPEANYPVYFEAIKTERTVAAHDAHQHPATYEFSESYLSPLGITSMLDVPVWAGQEMVGVICCEHVGPKKVWSQDEERFAYIMSGLVAIMFEQQGLTIQGQPDAPAL